MKNTDKQCTVTLSCLCTQLINCVNTHRIIKESNLFDLAMASKAVISNSNEFPKEFIELSSCLSNYWRTKAASDENKERAFSYIRAYQICSMAETEMALKRSETNLSSVSEKQTKYG